MGGNCATGQDLTLSKKFRMLNFLWCQNAKFGSRVLFGTQIQFLEVDFSGNQNANFGSRHFVIGAKIPGKGMAVVVMGGFLSQFSLEEGQKRVAFASHRKLLRTQFPFMPWRSDLARNGRGMAVIQK